MTEVTYEELKKAIEDGSFWTWQVTDLGPALIAVVNEVERLKGNEPVDPGDI